MTEKEIRTENQKTREFIKEAAAFSIPEILNTLHTTPSGLDEEAVSLNRTRYGSNSITREKKKSVLGRSLSAFTNPFTIILFLLALVSCLTDIVFPLFCILGTGPEDFNPSTAVIILSMILISGILHFIEEKKSSNATEKLMSMITTTCTVTRKGRKKEEIPLGDLVVGDIVHLSAGDMVPADVRILEAGDFFVSQAALTGESIPIEKTGGPCTAEGSITDYPDIAFMAGNVISGSADAVVIRTGDNTLLGSMASTVREKDEETNFKKGVNSVSRLLLRFMLVMVPLVFFINGITKGDWLNAFMFGVSIAIGLTPEMLPMIVTTCLAKGAVSMSLQNTIVKKLNSTQNFGAVDILCTDKTGTLTQNRVMLEYHLNVNGEEDAGVLRLA